MTDRRNARFRRKITEAVKTMPTPFTAAELASVVNLQPKKVSSMLRAVEGLTRIPKTNGRERVQYVREEKDV